MKLLLQVVSNIFLFRLNIVVNPDKCVWLHTERSEDPSWQKKKNRKKERRQEKKKKKTKKAV